MLASLRGGHDTESPGSPLQGAGRPARVSILPGDPQAEDAEDAVPGDPQAEDADDADAADDASAEGSPGGYGSSSGFGLRLSQIFMSQSSESSTLNSTDFYSFPSSEEKPRPPIPSGKILAAGKYPGTQSSDDGDGRNRGSASRDEPASSLAFNGGSLTPYHLSDEVCHQCISMLPASFTSPLVGQKEQLDGLSLTQWHVSDEDFHALFSELESRTTSYKGSEGAPDDGPEASVGFSWHASDKDLDALLSKLESVMTSSIGPEGAPDDGPQASAGVMAVGSSAGTEPKGHPPDFAASKVEDVLLLHTDSRQCHLIIQLHAIVRS